MKTGCRLWDHPVTNCDDGRSATKPAPRQLHLSQFQRRQLRWVALAHRWCVLALALVAVASPAWGQAVVVKDVLCGFPNLSNGDWIYNARGRSTIAPNGIRHLVCWARVPPPRVEIRVEGHSADACWIEDAFVPSWAEHISSSGEATFECWNTPGRR